MPRLRNSKDFPAEAMALLARQAAPETVSWDCAPDFAKPEASQPPGPRQRPRSIPAHAGIVPASFVHASEYVVRHRDADRFELLYRVLWRLVHEPGLRTDRSDADMSRVSLMAHAVRRDIHKLKSRIRLRAVTAPGMPRGELMVAWCEPVHRVLEPVAQWLAGQQPSECWMLLAPDASAFWDTQCLLCGPGAGGAPPASDGEWASRQSELFCPQAR